MSGAAVAQDEVAIKSRDNTTTMDSSVSLTCLQGEFSCYLIVAFGAYRTGKRRKTAESEQYFLFVFLYNFRLR